MKRKKVKTQKMWCQNCKKIGVHTFVEDKTGSGPGYYQSTMGPATFYEVWKCPHCKRKIGYTSGGDR